MSLTLAQEYKIVDKYLRLFTEKSNLTLPEIDASLKEVAGWVIRTYGIAGYSFHGDSLFINIMSGDAKELEWELIQIAKANGCTKLRAVTQRNPKAFARKHGAKLVGYIIEKEINYE